MTKYYSFSLLVLLFLAGCMASNIEDPSSLRKEGFKQYEQPDIYVEDSLLSQPLGSKKHPASEMSSKRSSNSESGSKGVNHTMPSLEWIAGPDKDTTWDQARSWVKNLTVDGGGWRMPTIKELKTLYQKGDTFLLSNTTGRYVWSVSTKGPFMWLFSFRYGVDKWDSPGQSKHYRGFAVRSQN
jgi:hypothetical protein